MILLPLFPKLRIFTALLYPFLVYALWRRGLPRVGMTDPAQRSRMLSLLCALPLLELFVVGIDPHRHTASLLYGLQIGFGPLNSPLLHHWLCPNAPFGPPPGPLSFFPFPFHFFKPPSTPPALPPLWEMLPLSLLLMARLGGTAWALGGGVAEYACALACIRRMPRRDVGGGVVVLDVPGWCAFTFGLLRPRIFISAQVWNSPHRASVLAHEQGHAQRRDPLRRFAARATQRLLWYLPFWRTIARQMDVEAERACDLRGCRVVGRAAYASALLAFADQPRGAFGLDSVAPGFASLSASPMEDADQTSLLARARFLNDTPQDATPRLFWPLFALVYALIMLAA